AGSLGFRGWRRGCVGSSRFLLVLVALFVAPIGGKTERNWEQQNRMNMRVLNPPTPLEASHNPKVAGSNPALLLVRDVRRNVARRSASSPRVMASNGIQAETHSPDRRIHNSYGVGRYTPPDTAA